MNRQVLACTLALLSASTHGLQASQAATDYPSKFKSLSSMLPDIPRHYAALRTGCVQASWIAERPAVQKFMQTNFNTLATVFATMVSFFALRTLYRWNNDRKFDNKFKNDPQFCEQALEVVFDDALPKLYNNADAYAQRAVALRHPSRYGKLGVLIAKGDQTNQNQYLLVVNTNWVWFGFTGTSFTYVPRSQCGQYNRPLADATTQKMVSEEMAIVMAAQKSAFQHVTIWHAESSETNPAVPCKVNFELGSPDVFLKIVF